MTNNGPFKKYIIDAVVSVKNEIEKDPLTRKNLTEIVLDAGIGINRFNKAFKHIAGCSFKEYRVNRRMEKAKEWLEEGKTRKEIARKLGYRTPGNFSAAFKRKFGHSPFKHLPEMNAKDNLKERVTDFLNDYVTEYVNPHEVSIMLFNDLTVYVAAKYPGFNSETDDIEFFCLSNSLEEFFDRFEINNFKDLGNIKLSHLEKLFLQATAQIFCFVGNCELVFKKLANDMEVSDGRGNFHKLPGFLYKPNEFIEHTREYYHLENNFSG